MSNFTRISRQLATILATAALAGCSGGSPAAPPAGNRPAAAPPVAATAPATGNAVVDSALGSLSELRTALDGIRALDATSAGLVVQSLSISSSPSPSATPAATPQPSPTATASPHPSPTPTATPHPSATPTATPHPSATPTATPHPSPTATASATPHASPTPTATPWPSPTPTASPTHKPSATPTPHAEPSPSPTPSGDDIGPASVERHPLDEHTDVLIITVVVDGKSVRIVKKVPGERGKPSPGPKPTANPSPESGIEQVVGDGEVKLNLSGELSLDVKIRCEMTFKSRARFQGDVRKKDKQAVVEGTLVTGDGRSFTLLATHTLGGGGLAGTIVLTPADGSLQISMDLNGDRTGVGIVRDLRLNRPVYTISVGSNGLAVIRDAEDHVVQKDIPLFKKA